MQNNNITPKPPLHHRPFWQRLLYPFVGIMLILLGIILWIIPVVMGFPLIIIGVPFLFCFHPRLERWVRGKMHTLWAAMPDKIKRRRGMGESS